MILRKKGNEMMIYLDNSATTKPLQEVMDSFNKVSEQIFCNPSSIHQFGGKGEQLLDKARIQAAELLKVRPQEVIFTSGGTEGNNLAIKGVALQNQSRGKHIITTEIEHPSVYETCLALEKIGFEVTYLPVDEFGQINIRQLEEAIRSDTILVSVMHVNNETGVIQPIIEIGELLSHYPKVFFHVDDVQGLGKVPLSIKKAQIDLWTCSGHKIHGLKGTGILYKRSGIRLFSLFHGGSQEMNVRAGTENLAGIVSFVKALRLIKEKESSQIKRLTEMKTKIVTFLEQEQAVVLNTPTNSAPHIVSFSLLDVKPEVAIHMLGEKEIYISTKSACSSKDAHVSRVLAKCGYGFDRASTGLRVSLSYENTMEEIEQFLSSLQPIINQLKGMLK